jgi:hypothetical protein
MKVKELILELRQHNPESVVRFSMAIDTSPDPGERWFCEDGPEEIIGNASDLDRETETEVTICLVGESNLK